MPMVGTTRRRFLRIGASAADTAGTTFIKSFKSWPKMLADRRSRRLYNLKPLLQPGQMMIVRAIKKTKSTEETLIFI
jgi:hypothetical protein